MAKSITCVGYTIAVDWLKAGLRGEVRDYGKIPNTPVALQALVVKLAPERRELCFCYEAGRSAAASPTTYRGQARICAASGSRLTVGMH